MFYALKSSLYIMGINLVPLGHSLYHLSLVAHLLQQEMCKFRNCELQRQIFVYFYRNQDQVFCVNIQIHATTT